MDADPFILGVSDVSLSYGPAKRRRADGADFVVNGVSFTVGRGETFSLVGESGSGKSTIGKAILRLIETPRGSITFDGVDITAFGRKTPLWYRRRVQVVFQDPRGSLNPRMTVGDTISEATRRHSTVRGPALSHAVAQLLSDVGLQEHHAAKRPAELSGGQQQRVAIARALATSPDLVVCDEPVSALDVSTQSQIMNLFEDLQEARGLSYLFISHDLSVVRHISDRIGVLYLGSLVEQGATESIFSQPTHWYTRELLAAVPDLGHTDTGVARAEREEAEES